MNNPYRTLLTEMAAELDHSQQLLTDNRKATHPLADRARALMDKPEPQPLADGEVAELVEGLKLISDGMSAIGHESDSWFVARAAELLQSRHPQPVAVSERPWKREGWCDEQGECWLETVTLFPDHPAWIKTCPAFAEKFPQCYVRSLPAHALPTPETTNG